MHLFFGTILPMLMLAVCVAMLFHGIVIHPRLEARRKKAEPASPSAYAGVANGFGGRDIARPDGRTVRTEKVGPTAGAVSLLDTDGSPQWKVALSGENGVDAFADYLMGQTGS